MKTFIRFTAALAVILIMSITSMGCKKEGVDISIPSQGLGAPPPLSYKPGTYDVSEVNALSNDIDKAILLFTYASYNQVDAPYFYFWAEGRGDTLVGTMLSQSIRVQVGLEYFHQVLSKVTEIKSVALKPAVSFVERAKRRVNYDSKQYRYDGKNIVHDTENDKLIAAWNSPGAGTSYTPEKGEYTTLSNIDFSVREAIKSATVTTVNVNGRSFYKVTMEADATVVNGSEYSMERLKSDSSADPVSYKYYTIEFEVWDLGYFRMINYIESWEGKIGFEVFGKHIGVSGSSESTNHYTYSYDIEDCNLEAYIEMAKITLKAAE